MRWLRWLRRNLMVILVAACFVLAGIATYLRYEPTPVSASRELRKIPLDECPALIARRLRHNPEQNGSTNESGGNDATDPSDGPAPGPGPSDPSGGDSGGDPGDGGGGVADDPPATDPPPAGGGGGENPRPPDGGGDPPALSPPTADPSPPTLGETIDGATGTVCGITGPLPVVCPPRGVGQ